MSFKIYTKTGDKGETSLYGGKRVDKNHARVEAYGDVDELNAHLGLLVALIKPDDIKPVVEKWQHILFDVGSELATPLDKMEQLKIRKVSDKEVLTLESEIDQMERELQPLTQFILPGGDQIVAQIHICRTICRRVERKVVTLDQIEKQRPTLITFINRFSDYLFVLGRFVAMLNDVKETPWKPTN